MKTNLLPKIHSAFLQVGLVMLVLIGLITRVHAGAVLPPVGPDTPDPSDRPITCGYLEVYSSTEASDSKCNEDTSFYPHSAYWIYDQAGNRIKTVQNHGMAAPEEGPTTVELKPGTYSVRAYADHGGLVTVPVIIKLARTTSVHLDR